MSLNESPTSKENELKVLKARLDEFVGRSSITKFEGEDIIELIQEGESIDWILDQLKGDDPKIDVDAITALLADIGALIQPEKAPEVEGEEPGRDGTAAASLEESGAPDVSQLDLSGLDLSQLGDVLPPGVEPPPGLNLKEIKDLIESPQGRIMADFLLFCREKGIDLSGNLADPRVQKLQNEWQSTPRDAFDGKTPAEMLADNPTLMPGKVETYRREEPRVGRNDPCPCGSGKKYKKCCGRK